MKKIITISLLIFIAVNVVACKSTDKVKSDADIVQPTNQTDPVTTVIEEPVPELYPTSTLVLPNGVTVRTTDRGKILILEKKVLFKMASTELPYEFNNVVSIIVRILDDNPNISIVLEGHTSNRGQAYPHNYNLSVVRVDNAYKVFMNSGIAPSKIIKSPLGESLPESDYQEDLRRFEYVIIENEADVDKYNNFVKTLDLTKESNK